MIVITRLQLLRNVGMFDNVSAPATLDLKRLTLVYAENGRGKTTLAAILRSLGTGEALPVDSVKQPDPPRQGRRKFTGADAHRSRRRFRAR